MSTYNGWTNYATWRVNLELFDGIYYDTWKGYRSAYDLGQALQEYAQELISEQGGNSLATDYALAFLSDVDWAEIARHILEDLAEDEETEESEKQ
jgi:hypothetical protein